MFRCVACVAVVDVGGLLFRDSFIFIFSAGVEFGFAFGGPSVGAIFDSTDCGVVFGVAGIVGVEAGPVGVEPPGVNGGGGDRTFEPGVVGAGDRRGSCLIAIAGCGSDGAR